MNPTISTPSDNLYKFFAVVGLIVVGACIAYPASQRKEFDQLSTKYDGDVLQLDTERNLADEAETADTKRIHTHAKELAAILEANQKGQKPPPMTPEMKKELEDLDRVLAERQKTKKALIVRSAEMDTRRAGLILSRQFLNKLDFAAGIVAPLAFLVSLFGFYKWFGSQRVQDKLQDKELSGEGLPVAHQPDSGPRWLRWAGIALLVVGGIGGAAVHVVSSITSCIFEDAILDTDEMDHIRGDIITKALSKTMDSAALDDRRLTRNRKNKPEATREEKLEAAEELAKEDKDVAPLKSVLMRLFSRQDREKAAEEWSQQWRRYSPWGYAGAIGTLLLGGGCIGICNIVGRRRQATRTPAAPATQTVLSSATPSPPQISPPAA